MTFSGERSNLKRWYLIIGIGFSYFLFFSCSETTNKNINPAFYHWKTNFQLTDFEKNYLDSLDVQKLYVKFFDVDWDFKKKEAIPKAAINFKTIPLVEEIIPTIFITNRTFENIALTEIPTLAKRMEKRIYALAEQIPDFSVKEIQLDCDWTMSTKEHFFDLLRQLNLALSEKGVITSATIRLHQIKYFEKTGVPPADKGILMFYNMGDIDNWETQNSILDLEIGQQYFKNFDKYPLQLDVALPLFQWGILFRDKRMILIINNLTETELEDEERFLKIGKNRFQVLKSTYLNGHYLYEEDLIRLENINHFELEKSAQALSKLVQNPAITLSFYHLDSLSISKYPVKNIKSIIESFY